MQRRSFLRVIGAAASAVMLPLSAFGGVTPTGGVVSSTPAVIPAAVGDLCVPEMWAKESLAILQENIVLSKLIHRDFQDKLDSGQKYDRVNVGKGIRYSTWRKA